MNQDFLDTYNRLNNVLIKIVGGKEGDVLISYLEEVSPEKIASQLKTIRHFRNNIPGHGVSVNGAMPEPPVEWIKFLNKEIQFVKNNANLISNKINAALNNSKKAKIYADKRIDSVETCSFLIKRYIEKKSDSPIKKIVDFLINNRDFTKVLHIIKFTDGIEEESNNKSVLLEFLMESKKIAEEIKPVQYYEKSGFKKYKMYKPNNNYWLKYFDSSDFETYLWYCNKYKINIIIYEE